MFLLRVLVWPCLLGAIVLLVTIVDSGSPLTWYPHQDAALAQGPPCRSLHTLTVAEFITRETIGQGSRNSSCAIAVLHGGFHFTFQQLEGSGPLLYLHSTWVLSLESMLWFEVSRFPDLDAHTHVVPAARGGHSMVYSSTSSRDALAMFGGTDGVSVFNDVWLFVVNINGTGLDCNAWQIVTQHSNSRWQAVQPTGTAPAPRWGHAGVVVNTTQIVFGGFSSPLGTSWLFNLF